jgi:arsenate reductase
MSETNKLTIYHNPRCSKSRETMTILEEHEQNPEVVEYLKTPPDRQTLLQIVARGIPLRDLLRTGETAFKEMDLNVDSMTDDDIINLLLENPALLQRPIVVLGDKAVIGRPPARVLELMQSP